MKLTRVIAIAVIVASGALGGASGLVQAQSLRNADEPAEFPPSTYKGRQYVDSRGCVYIRAGIDGNVTWVPRVSRSRTLVCGFQPSNAGTRSAQVAKQPAPKPAAKPAATPVRTATTASTTTTTAVRATQPRAVTQPVRRATPVLVRPTAPATTTTVAKAVPVAKPAPKVVKTQTRTVARAQPACSGLSAVSARYMASSSRHKIRCGPQAEAPHSGARVTSAPRTYAASPQPYVRQTYATNSQAAVPSPQYAQATRIAPRHVYENQQAAKQGTLFVPEGYQRVWMDGRLNPKRAHQSFQGKDQMDLIWTRTVPRKLIVRRTGRVVTRDYPGLVYPYTSYDQMNLAQSQPVISSMGQAPATTRAVQSTVKQPAAASTSTQRASHSYVQAGVYATRAQAAQAAQRLARTGVTTRLGSLTKGGKQYSLVLAGPFQTQGQLNGALAKARAAGFGNARLRK